MKYFILEAKNSKKEIFEFFPYGSKGEMMKNCQFHQSKKKLSKFNKKIACEMGNGLEVFWAKEKASKHRNESLKLSDFETKLEILFII